MIVVGAGGRHRLTRMPTTCYSLTALHSTVAVALRSLHVLPRTPAAALAKQERRRIRSLFA